MVIEMQIFCLLRTRIGASYSEGFRISETKEVGANQRTAVVCCKKSVRLGVLQYSPPRLVNHLSQIYGLRENEEQIVRASVRIGRATGRAGPFLFRKSPLYWSSPL